MGIVLKNILAVLPEGEKDVVKETDIYIEGSRIAAIGRKPEGFMEEKVIDGKDRLAIPGLINCHTHSYMSFMRNVADDLSFMDWLFGSIDPIEQKMTDEDTYWGACLAIIEMMKSGTTCFNDMQMNIHQTTRAVRESGMRAVISRGLVGEGNNEAGQMRLSQAYEERDAAKAKENILILKSIDAVGKLTYANAIAIRDGKTNGEMHEAMECYSESKQEMYDYLLEHNSKK